VLPARGGTKLFKNAHALYTLKSGVNPTQIAYREREPCSSTRDAWLTLNSSGTLDWIQKPGPSLHTGRRNP
jgi:hypothetical protein